MSSDNHNDQYQDNSFFITEHADIENAPTKSSNKPKTTVKECQTLPLSDQYVRELAQKKGLQVGVTKGERSNDAGQESEREPKVKVAVYKETANKQCQTQQTQLKRDSAQTNTKFAFSAKDNVDFVIKDKGQQSMNELAEFSKANDRYEQEQ